MSKDEKYETESFMNEDAELHVVPTIDYLRHWFSATCWCGPKLTEKKTVRAHGENVTMLCFEHKRIMDKENQH